MSFRHNQEWTTLFSFSFIFALIPFVNLADFSAAAARWSRAWTRPCAECASVANVRQMFPFFFSAETNVFDFICHLPSARFQKVCRIARCDAYIEYTHAQNRRQAPCRFRPHSAMASAVRRPTFRPTRRSCLRSRCSRISAWRHWPRDACSNELNASHLLRKVKVYIMLKQSMFPLEIKSRGGIRIDRLATTRIPLFAIIFSKRKKKRNQSLEVRCVQSLP